jgi:hypothetical protein
LSEPHTDTPPNGRVPRAEAGSREQDMRPQAWSPATTLPEPDKLPGYAYRWVRASTLGQADPRNLSGKLREGWEPVRIEEQPRFKMFIDPASRFKDNIEVAGLLLCKAPEEFVAQRKAHYARLTQQQSDAVDNNFMKENDPRMPLFRERRSTRSFGRGS